MWADHYVTKHSWYGVCVVDKYHGYGSKVNATKHINHMIVDTSGTKCTCQIGTNTKLLIWRWLCLTFEKKTNSLEVMTCVLASKRTFHIFFITLLMWAIATTFYMILAGCDLCIVKEHNRYLLKANINVI